MNDVTGADRYAALRAEVRALCAAFPDEYRRRLDRERGYLLARTAPRAARLRTG